jgi:hypothetical protein
MAKVGNTKRSRLTIRVTLRIAAYIERIVPILRNGSVVGNRIQNIKENKMKFRPGDKVQICEGSGILSGWVATVVDWKEIMTNGRGVPLILGHYHPVDRKRQIPVRYEDGFVDTIFKDRLRKI